MIKKEIKNIKGTNKKKKEKFLTSVNKIENLVAEIMPVYTRLTKENITEIKHTGYNEIADLVKKQKDAKYISFILENLGLLPEDFNGNFLYELLNHNNENVRFLTVKNIGKLKDENLISILTEFFQKESNTTVKREIVSSIGRQRNPKAKSFLFNVLENNDPKIVCQAIRGLLVFKNDKEIEEKLKPLINHPNEMVRSVIYKEYYAKEVDTTNQMPHMETYEFLKNVVVNGDVLDILKIVPDESIHLTFTSPPYYNARDYSIYQSYQDYLDFLDKVFKETHRITKEGRFLIVNTSPIIIPRVSRSHSSKRYPIPFDLHPYLIKMGWTFIDDIVWLKPEYSVKNRIGGFQQHRKPLAYKPNSVTEYLMVYRKDTDKLLDWNIRQYDWDTVLESKVDEGYETTNVWKIDPCFNKIHTAVFPMELCKRVIQYYSFKGDIVFDPFCGSGTVGRTAKSLGRLFFLTEINKQYFEYMQSKTNTEGRIYEKYVTKFLTLTNFINTIK